MTIFVYMHCRPPDRYQIVQLVVQMIRVRYVHRKQNVVAHDRHRVHTYQPPFEHQTHDHGICHRHQRTPQKSMDEMGRQHFHQHHQHR